MSELAKRSEILFCYDVRMANPNGDPDENRPRIDLVTRRNLVTDFRLKRTIRDYIVQHFSEKQGYRIFIRAETDEAGNLKQIEDLAEPYIKEDTTKKKGSGKEIFKKTVNKKALIKDHIDIRAFGILFAVNIEKQNISFKQIGPVQFAIGQSMHPVEEQTIRMTCIVPTRAEVQAGTMGEKSILRYSFIAFRGFVNDIVARETELTEDDVQSILEAIWYGTNSLSTTSKYGQQSRLLLRAVYKKPNMYIGDFDRLIDLNTKGVDPAKLENPSQFHLNVDKLLSTLTERAAGIESIYYASNKELLCTYKGHDDTFSILMKHWTEDVGKKHGIKTMELFKE